MRNIDRLLSSPEEFAIYSYKWNENGTLDVFQDVDLSYLDLESFPFDFNIIAGNFLCHKNKLSSLIGSPKEVFGDFNCAANDLTSLQHGPLIVKGEYNCNENKFSNLQYMAKDVTTIRCSNNGMT